MVGLPSQVGQRDQNGFGAIDVALAGEEIGVSRPTSDCASAGEVLVPHAGRDVC
jgi:hypothetical protein